jgi:phosphatidylinositol glycan class N
LLQALAYIHREVLTGLYILAAFWPATYGFSFLRAHAALSLTWFLSCLTMSTFTLLPAMKVEDRTLM